MPPHLRLIELGDDPEQNREVTVTGSEFLIGRGADCDLRLPVGEVSRHHCIVRVSQDEASVLDLGSSNGTFLNGQRVLSQAVLRGGDELQIGPCRFVVNLGGTGEGGAEPAAGTDPLARTLRVRDLAARLASEEAKDPARKEAGGDRA